MRLAFSSSSSSFLFPRRALWTVGSFSLARIWSQSTRPLRPQGGRGMSQVFNLFPHHHDGGSGASNYKDLRGGTRCAVTDSQFTNWTTFTPKISALCYQMQGGQSKLKNIIGSFDDAM